jgi:hypothetical protein
MPEFQLDASGEVQGRTFEELDPFTRGYIEALFFTETSSIPMVDWHSEESQHRVHEGQADGSIPADAGFSDLHPDSIARIMRDCEAFQTRAAVLLAEAYKRPDYSAEQAGRDYWYTRNGHGVGFWDREPLEANGLGDNLSELAGDDGVDVSFSEVEEVDSPSDYGFVYVE